MVWWCLDSSLVVHVGTINHSLTAAVIRVYTCMQQCRHCHTNTVLICAPSWKTNNNTSRLHVYRANLQMAQSILCSQQNILHYSLGPSTHYMGDQLCMRRNQARHDRLTGWYIHVMQNDETITFSTVYNSQLHDGLFVLASCSLRKLLLGMEVSL